MVNESKIDVGCVWFTHFHLEGFVNKQNWRIWSAKNPSEFIEKPLHSSKVTVWYGLSSKGITLFFIREMINTFRYTEVLQ